MNRSPRRQQHSRSNPQPERSFLHGRHAVEAALTNPRRRLVKLWATKNALQRFDFPLPPTLTVEIVMPQVLDRMAGPDSVHQGLVLEAAPLDPLPIEDVQGDGTILVLDQITDPHNVGAILRLAAAFGVKALLTTERHGPSVTAALAKAASGGLEHVPLVREPNLARAIETLKNKGFTVVGLDSEAESALPELDLAPPLALVLGAEGKGLRRLTRERCDMVARIPLPGAIISLNVSTATAIALYIAAQATKS